MNVLDADLTPGIKQVVAIKMETMIASAEHLAAMPVIAMKIMRMINDEKTTAEKLAGIVAADQAIAARVLRISNSAYYGFQRQIKTLTDATIVLGFESLKSIVVAASIKEIFRAFGQMGKMLWAQSLGAALAAGIIAREIKVLHHEEAFLAGLLIDI